MSHSIHDVSTLLKIDVSDIGSLISNGRVSRPARPNGQWVFSQANIDELKSVPQELLPSHQRLYRQKAFWAKQIEGVVVPGTVIALTKEACDDPLVFENNKAIIVRDYAKEFVVYARSTNPADLTAPARKVFQLIQAECEGAVEFREALGLITEQKLVSTHQLALLCGTNDNTIRSLWKQRRVAPYTMSQANALLWKLDLDQVEAIKLFLTKQGDLPPQKVSARKDIVHFHIEE